MSFTGSQQQGFLKFNQGKNPNTVYAQRAPTANDTEHQDGTPWVDQANSVAYIKIKSSAGSADWVTAGSVSVPVTVAQGGTGVVSVAADSLLAGDGTDPLLAVSRDEFIRQADVVLTAVQVKALRATPITLVAAPGAGKAIFLQSAILKLNYGSEVFAETTDNLAIKLTDGSGAAVSQTIESTGFIDQAADTYTTAFGKIDAIATAAAMENAAIVIHNTGDGEITGNASDDSTVSVRVFYRVVEI